MIEAVIFDWAGTTVDYGCFAPVQAFMESFAHFHIPVTIAVSYTHLDVYKRQVVNHAGRLAPGWAEQRFLLEAEGVAVKDNNSVDLKKYQWNC